MTSQVTVIGNLTRDPELRFTPSGAAVTNFGIASNRRWQDARGEWQEATSFYDVICWRQLAENTAESLTKGTNAIVVGRLDQRSWETDAGERRSKIEIVADHVGPSLRWATALTERNERRSDTGDPGPVDPHHPGPAVPVSADGYTDQEEPF